LSLKVDDLCLLLDVLTGDPFDEIELSAVFSEELLRVEDSINAVTKQHLDPSLLLGFDAFDRNERLVRHCREALR